MVSHFLVFAFCFSVLCPQVHAGILPNVSEGARVGMFLKKDLRSWGRQQKKKQEERGALMLVFGDHITSQREDWPGSVTSSCSEAFENRWSQQIRRRSGQMNTPQGTSQCCVWKQLFSRFNYHSTALSYSPGLESSDCHAPRSSMFTAVPRQQE